MTQCEHLSLGPWSQCDEKRQWRHMMNKTKPQRFELLILKTQARSVIPPFLSLGKSPPTPPTYTCESFNEAVSTTQIINVEFSQEMIICDKVEGIRKEEAGLFLTFNIVNVSCRLPCTNTLPSPVTSREERHWRVPTTVTNWDLALKKTLFKTRL